jgi:hypothetical protein
MKLWLQRVKLPSLMVKTGGKSFYSYELCAYISQHCMHLHIHIGSWKVNSLALCPMNLVETWPVVRAKHALPFLRKACSGIVLAWPKKPLPQTQDANAWKIYLRVGKHTNANKDTQCVFVSLQRYTHIHTHTHAHYKRRLYRHFHTHKTLYHQLYC